MLLDLKKVKKEVIDPIFSQGGQFSFDLRFYCVYIVSQCYLDTYHYKLCPCQCRIA